MEPELSSIFWIKMVAKNIVLGSPGTHFIYMRVKTVMIVQEKPIKLKYWIVIPMLLIFFLAVLM